MICRDYDKVEDLNRAVPKADKKGYSSLKGLGGLFT